ncbi:hypothetical protein P3G55_11780 [Leptospira sp. 96542]|nr:hypothetical protein [Leptospira sp. 96542]
MKNFFLSLFPILVFVSITIFLFSKRLGLDSKGFPLIQSDAQIKLYQVVKYAQEGVSENSCYYPGKTLDPNFKFFPFDYPWAVPLEKKTLSEECYFQYPSFFAIVSLPVYRLFGLFGLTWMSFVLYILASILIFQCLRNEIGSKGILFQSMIVGILLFGYPIYSAYEYTETTVAVVLILAFYFRLFGGQKNVSNFLSRVFDFCLGFVCSIAPILRSEMFIYLLFFGILLVLLKKELVSEVFRTRSFLLAGFIFGIIAFMVWNFSLFGHIFGVRGMLSLQDMGGSSFEKRLFLIKDFYFGNEHKIGWIRSVGVLFISIVFSNLFIPSKSSVEKNNRYFWFLNAILPVFVISVISPYNPGNLFAGLRFTDISFYLMVFAQGIILKDFTGFPSVKEKIYTTILFVMLASQVYLQARITKGFFALMVHVRDAQVELLQIWKEHGNLPVIHKNVFDGLLISLSYLEQYHFLAINREEAIELQNTFKMNNIPGFYLIWYDAEKPFDPNFSKEMYDTKINNKYEFPEENYKLSSDRTEKGFRLQYYSLVGAN